jgi:hypothetical protein
MYTPRFNLCPCIQVTLYITTDFLLFANRKVNSCFAQFANSVLAQLEKFKSNIFGMP